MILPALGILLLACGSAALNHYQERDTDKLMQRTKNRPLPSGRISSKTALIVVLLLTVSGSALLYFGAGLTSLLLGLITMIWYNAIYTPLKRKNSLAIIPGSVIGALPPVIGWVSAGGNIFDSQVLLIAFFFFIWQIPHFWLLVLVFNTDYESAGFPTIFKHFNRNQIARITYVWTIATGLTGLLFPIFSIMKINFSAILMFGAFLWLLYKSSVLLRQDISGKSFRYVFREINMYVVFIVLLVSADKLLLIF